MFYVRLLVLLIPLVSTAHIKFKYPQDHDLEPLVPKCPDEHHNAEEPWYEDPYDCNCYYVCDSGIMSRKCCPTSLWFDSKTLDCAFAYSFTKMKRAQCWANLKGEGSTQHLSEIFIGRCLEYQLFRNPALFRNQHLNCTELLEKFQRVFFLKPPCGEIEVQDYDDFLNLAEFKAPPDKSMFWSGTFAVVNDYSHGGKRMTTMESTVAGYLLNELQWCGTVEDPGINYKTCPPLASCDGEARFAFWARASQKYASQASGIATVMLNGSTPGIPAYRNTSFFAQHELVNLKVPKVHTLRIWVIQDLDRPVIESCDMGSIKLLQTIATNMGLDVICENTPQ